MALDARYLPTVAEGPESKGQDRQLPQHCTFISGVRTGGAEMSAPAERNEWRENKGDS
jgi:hypothetical protein